MELPLSVSFPSRDPSSVTPLSNSISVSSVKQLSILAVASQDPQLLSSNVASKVHDRFGADMQLRADTWHLTARGVPRNDSEVDE
jgi:hypothetical protein